MSVVSSTLRFSHRQIDGRRWCHEDHLLSDGRVLTTTYSTEDDDAACAATMAARVDTISSGLSEAEADDNLERDAAPTLHNQTAAEFRQRVREAFRRAERERACYLAWWLLRRIAAGHITDAQARGVFGLTSQQWTNLKTNKLQPRADAWAAVLAATGE